MKTMKFILMTVLITMISCNLRKENNFTDNDNIDVIDLKNDKSLLVKKDYYGTYSFSNWNDFNISNIRLHEIESLDFNTSITRMNLLSESILGMDECIPDWLKTDKALKEIEEIEEKFSILVDQRYSSTTKIRKNWENLSNKFDDLREELKETVEENQS